ncbi:hypothetical protein BD779DRAFT_1679537 [Infundibulicybe gibba]|nr:hypothetical protein BD779DRAFT_1679537 [Infundibulicybe gibba]
MPARRPSASVGPFTGSSIASSAPRAHRNNESHHIHPVASKPDSLLTLGTSTTPQQKVVLVLVNRLKQKLPCNSGLSLDRLEGNSATQETIDALVELSHESLDIIAWSLTELLGQLASQTNTSGLLTIEVLQSQLFILKVLSVAMAARSSHPLRAGSPPTSDPGVPNISPRDKQMPSEDSSTHSVAQDIPPLDDKCAEYILVVMILFLRQTASPESPLMLPSRSSDLSFRDFESLDTTKFPAPPEVPRDPPPSASAHPPERDPMLRSQPSSNSVKSGNYSISSLSRLSVTSALYEKTHMSLVRSPISMNSLISKFAGRIIHHISASNWPVVFKRLRDKIRQLADKRDEDIVDLQLMALSSLNRQRLVQLLNELSSLLVNMRREAQLAIAVPLRSAIWNWIEIFPGEFNDAIRSRGKTEGAPERVFDLLYAKHPAGFERILWPTLTILYCITSDRVAPDFQQYKSITSVQKTTRKEFKFGEDILKHAGTNSKLSEVALVCALDMCRAATHVTPRGEVPLRMIAQDIAHEIRSTLSTGPTRKPFWEMHEEIDIAVFAEAMVSIFRFLPQDEAIALFTLCVEPERSEAVKTCAVRACLTLVQEAPRISWQKPLDKLEEALAQRFRNIFKTAGIRKTEMGQNNIVKRISPRPKAKRHVPQPLSDREVLLLAILSLWRADALFYLKNITENDIDEWVLTAVKLWEAPVDISVKVSTACCFCMVAELTFLLSPLEPHYRLMIHLIKSALPPTLLSLVTNLINARTDTELQRLWIAMAHQLVGIFMRKSDLEHVKEIQCDVGRLPAFALAEIAFIISLTSADNNVSKLAAQGLRLLSHAERQPGAPMNPTVSDEDRSKRNPIYEQLGDPKIMVVGRVGHQKRIRKLVRLMTYPSAAHIAVWEECYWRWRDLSESIFASFPELSTTTEYRPNYAPPLEQDQIYQWQNLTLFLAALGGACVQDGQDLTPLTEVIPENYIPDKMRVLQDPTPLVGNFIFDLTNFLMAPETQYRDTAREALGAELSPRLYSKLLKHLDETLRSIEQGAGIELTDAYLLFLDQFIAILKLLVENGHVPLEDVMSIDISSTLLTLATFIARFGGPTSFRVKMKFCLMCDTVCDRTDTLTLRKDNNARHHILDIIIQWMQHTEDHTGIKAELNFSCLRTSVKLLDRLQLRPMDESSAGDDIMHVVSRLFSRYSTTLLQGLEMCPKEAEMEGGKVDVKLAARRAEIRELVITGLAYLVSANTESGFKHCLPLAYDPDNSKRTIFAHVFARVIGQGTKFDPEDRSTTVARHTRLCELVRGSGLALAMTICEICPPSEVEMMISVLLNVFDTRSSLMALLKLMIEREVAHTDNEANLFRSNSTCARFLSAFARIHGYNYLRNLIQFLIKTMASMPPGHGYEVDPNKAVGQDVAQNLKNVEVVASSFLEMIASSVPALPSMFREISAHISKVVAEVWPNAKFAAMGSFIFLRFISPAVVTPELVDVEVPKEHALVIRRGLMVIAKIIQSLANNIFFGKEAFMVVLNQFLQQNIKNVTLFLSQLQKYSPTDAEEENNEWLGTTSDDTDIIVLHRFFDKHADKIGKELLSLSKTSSEGDAYAASGKRAWDGLCALLVDLGAPLEVPRLSALNYDEHHEYLDLVARYANRETNQVGRIFMETDGPQDQPAVFLLCLSKIDVEAIDIELLMYHIFKTLNQPQYENRLFEIILDCTSFTSISEVPLKWLKYCAELVPADIRSRFIATHILNPNALTQKYLRRLYNVSAGTPFCGEIRAYSSIWDLPNHVPESALAALDYPVNLEREEHQTFRDATMKVAQMNVPIDLEVRISHLRITTVKTQPISPGLSCRSTEIIPLTDVSDIYNVTTGHEPHEFIIRRSRQGVTIYFSSPLRDTIVRVIRAAKNALKEAQAPLTEHFSQFSNVPATLLHIGLLSTNSSDEALRGGAYKLLGAVCTYLNYDKSPIVASEAGFIPGEPGVFSIQLSERLAEFAPQLTLDFLSEVSAAMTAMDHPSMSQRISCLEYMSPWVKNLAHFSNATHSLYERSGARLSDCIRVLADLSVNFPEIASTVQRYIWVEVSKLDTTVVNVVLDELVRAAVDGASLSSINVRGRIYSKLRKVQAAFILFMSNPTLIFSKQALSKTPPKIVNSLEDGPNWGEISILTRLAHVTGSQSKQASHHQLYIPEIMHLVTLVAGVGPTAIRKAVLGIVMNLLQSLYIFRTEDAPGAELLQLINDLTSPGCLKCFGLVRERPTSEYSVMPMVPEREYLDLQEQLAERLLRIMEVTSGSQGLLNVWRARWMSLITSTAFQLSPAIQTRSFIALGTLAIAEVDDDFLYQILVAFKSALTKGNDTHTRSIVSMLRCMCKIVPALLDQSRYICSMFWLAVALIQSSLAAFYSEAVCLLRVTLEKMEDQGMFKSESLSSVLLRGRSPLEEVTSQLDEILKISFDTSFSFCLAPIIFKGVRHSVLRDSAEKILRSLLRITIRTQHAQHTSNGFPDTLCPDALGYFLALLPFSTTPTSYRNLLDDCQVDAAWFPESGMDEYTEEVGAPRISLVFLGIADQSTALLATSFIGTMLTTAQGDDAETEILYNILSELANFFPETVSMIYESIQERVKDTFANSSNGTIIQSASNILRISLQDNPRLGRLRGSASSLSTMEDINHGAGRYHMQALDELGMQGLAHSFQFLTPGRTTQMMNWISGLVSLMIS